MPYSKAPPTYRPGGRPPGAAKLNASAELLRRLGNLRTGGAMMMTPAGPMGGQEGKIIRLGMTGPDGIPALVGSQMTGAYVTDVSLIVSAQDPLSGTVQTWEDTYVGWNLSSQPVAGSTLIISLFTQAMWLTIWEDCPSDSD
jgi:hypothetical protein